MYLKIILAALLATALTAAAGTESATTPEVEVRDTSFTEEGGGRVLQQSVEVPAPLTEVWAAFTTEEGFTSWAAPTAFIDLGIGGIIETSYALEAEQGQPGNIKNQIVAYLPERLLVLRNVQAPPGFAPRQLMDKWISVFEFEALSGSQTRVTVSGIGYGSDEVSHNLFEFFRQGNAWSLRQLAKRFTEGPVDWQALAVPGACETAKKVSVDGS